MFNRVLIVLSLSIILLIPFVLTLVLVFLFVDKKIFFTQSRIGLNRKIFRLIKFSSMKNNNNQDNLLRDEYYRINKVGYFIRKCHLDEIPQLYNFLKGDINLIGPRPWSLAHDNIYRNYLKNDNYLLNKYIKRTNVKPGIMGLAQLYKFNQETRKSIINRLRLDHFYIQNKSFRLKTYIFLSTIKKIFEIFFNK